MVYAVGIAGCRSTDHVAPSTTRAAQGTGSTAGTSPTSASSARSIATPNQPPPAAIPAWTWRSHDLPDTEFNSVSRGDDRFFTVGPEPGGDRDRWVLLASSDGIRWSVLARPEFDGASLRDVRWVEDRFVALVERPIPDAEPVADSVVAWTSPDGVEWTRLLDLSAQEIFPHAVTRISGRWVVATRIGAVMTSDDGKRWSEALQTRFGIGRPVLWPGGLVIPATGPDVAGRGQSQSMLHTGDGHDWSRTNLDDGQIAEVLSMAADQRVVVALGYARPDQVEFEQAGWWSSDGIDWKRATMPAEIQGGSGRIDGVAAVTGGFMAIYQADAPVSPVMIWSADGKVWAPLDGGPTGQIALPRMVPAGEGVLIYLQPYESEEWVAWEGIPPP